MLKLKAEWIIETHEQFCVRCQKRKAGRFLIIHFDNVGVHAYMGVCEDCLKERPIPPGTFTVSIPEEGLHGNNRQH